MATMPSPTTHVPVLPGTPIGTATPPKCQRAVANTTATDVAAMMERADLVARCPDIEKAITDQVAAEVESASLLPVEPETSFVDRWAVDAVTATAQLVERARSMVERFTEELGDRRAQRAALLRPWMWHQRLFLVARAWLAVIIGSALLAALMAPSFDVVFRWYVGDLFADGEVGLRGALLGVALAFACNFLVLGFEFMAITASWGRKLLLTKLGFLLITIGVAGAFGALRVVQQFSITVLALSALEFLSSLAATLWLFSLARRLGEDRDAREKYNLATAAIKVATENRREWQHVMDRYAKELAAQVAVLEERDRDARSLPRKLALATATARTMTLAETARQIARRAREVRAADDVTTALLDNRIERLSSLDAEGR